MDDWVTQAYTGMQERQAKRAQEVAEKAALLDAEQAAEPTKAEAEQAARTTREKAERERAEKIAASVQQGVRLRAAARRPMTTWERQVATQALGEVDHWDGPGGPAAA
nr:hypothetical protein OG999_29285 [Streptomyces sp. NBC_00886]